MNAKAWLLALLLGNGASAALLMGNAEDPEVRREPLPALEPAIRLLAEIDAPVPVAPEKQAPAPEYEPPEPVEVADLLLPEPVDVTDFMPGKSVETVLACLAWGPFNDTNELEPLVEEIRSAGGHTELLEASLHGEPDYLVLIGPEGSSEVVRRIHKELESLTIESHIINTGRFANTLSVGVFTELPRALAQQARVAELGYDVSIEELDRSQSVYHLLAEVRPDFTGSRAPSGDCADIAPEHQFL